MLWREITESKTAASSLHRQEDTVLEWLTQDHFSGGHWGWMSAFSALLTGCHHPVCSCNTEEQRVGNSLAKPSNKETELDSANKSRGVM